MCRLLAPTGKWMRGGQYAAMVRTGTNTGTTVPLCPAVRQVAQKTSALDTGCTT